MDFNAYAGLYKNALLNDVIPFWMENSKDDQFGGYFTCLDKTGRVFDTDKFVWLQCRQVWCFSMLYNQVEARQEWLDFAVQGAEFLKKNGRDREGNWYFSLDRAGHPLTMPHSIFSDCFAAMAYSQLFKATSNPEYRQIALDTFHGIIRKKDNPKGRFSKAFPGTRSLKNFALPMIICNLVLEMEHLLSPELVNQSIEHNIELVMNQFYRKDLGVILENLTETGEFSDSFEGRVVNPGHGLEAMWFIMDLAQRNGDGELTRRAVDIAIELLEYGWDREQGGIFYFLDVKGHPPLQLEWDQKLWWVHMETMITLLKGYRFTGDKRCWQWFEKVHEYTWAHFPDPENGEWFGYLNREGKVLLPLKGSKWKGCFHVPRGLFQCWKTLEGIAAMTPADGDLSAHRTETYR